MIRYASADAATVLYIYLFGAVPYNIDANAHNNTRPRSRSRGLHLQLFASNIDEMLSQ